MSVVRAKSKVPQKRTAFVYTLVTVVVVFAVFVLSKSGEETLKQNSASVADPVLEQKTIILAIVSSRDPLSDEQRDTLFLSLSGPKMLQYSFTEEEKKMIVKALNAVNSMPTPSKQKSSAREMFSAGSRAQLASSTNAVFLLTRDGSIII